MNPFGLNGIEAIIATAIVCLCVGGCVAASAWATVRTAETICDCIRDVYTDITDTIVTIVSGKAK